MLEGNPHLLLTQLYGVAIPLGWSVVMTYVLLKLVGQFVPTGVPCSRNWKASTSRSTARRFDNYLNTFSAHVISTHAALNSDLRTL